MTTISGVGGTTAMSSASLPSGAGLDGDTLLAYCALQLNDINGEIGRRLAKQQQVRDAKAGLNQIRDMINAHPNGGAYTREEKEAILTKYAETLRDMPPGPTRDSVMQSLQTFRATACYNNDTNAAPPPNIDEYLAGGIQADLDEPEATPAHDGILGTNALDEKEVGARVKELGDVGDELNKNAELDMIGLQQLISQRQMAVQQASQMMQKFCQTLEVVTSNIK